MATRARVGQVVNRTPLFKALLEGEVKNGARRASSKLRTFARRKVNRKYHKSSEPSRPGEPPKRRTGQGYYSIESVAERGSRGTLAKTFSSRRKAFYMSMYEYGGPRVKRPWLEPALRENKDELMRIMATPAKRRIGRGR